MSTESRYGMNASIFLFLFDASDDVEPLIFFELELISANADITLPVLMIIRVGKSINFLTQFYKMKTKCMIWALIIPI